MVLVLYYKYVGAVEDSTLPGPANNYHKEKKNQDHSSITEKNYNLSGTSPKYQFTIN